MWSVPVSCAGWGTSALFLTGVFPDYVARNGFGPIGEGRLLRAGGIANGRAEDAAREPGVAAFGDRGSVDLLEHLGRRWYQTAFELLPQPVAENVASTGRTAAVLPASPQDAGSHHRTVPVRAPRPLVRPDLTLGAWEGAVDCVQVQFAIDDAEKADEIVAFLLDRHLVACGQRIGPMVSRYWWEGSLEQAEEWLVLLKTRCRTGGPGDRCHRGRPPAPDTRGDHRGDRRRVRELPRLDRRFHRPGLIRMNQRQRLSIPRGPARMPAWQIWSAHRRTMPPTYSPPAGPA